MSNFPLTGTSELMRFIDFLEASFSPFDWEANRLNTTLAIFPLKITVAKQLAPDKILLTIVHSFYYNHVPVVQGGCVVSKLINEPIIVHISKASGLTSFIWRRKHYKVSEILSSWWEPSRWWDGEPPKFLIRVAATNRATGIYELFKLDGSWFLYRVFD
jgi:hypothetical protein